MVKARGSSSGFISKKEEERRKRVSLAKSERIDVEVPDHYTSVNDEDTSEFIDENNNSGNVEETCVGVTVKDKNSVELDHSYVQADKAEYMSLENADDSAIGILDLEADIECSTHSDNSWKEGRRIVNLKRLAEQLNSCCNCDNVLRLQNCTREQQYGLRSVLHITCDFCGTTNKVSTDTKHHQHEDRNWTVKGPEIWDSNTKAALGCLDAGMGHTQLIRLLATLNVPPVSLYTLRAREKEITNHLEKVAQESCQRALLEENSNTDGLAVSYDAGWQRQSTGHAYNSLSGYGALIGAQFGKIVRYAVRCKQCKVCEVAARKGRPPRLHKCYKNWTGSAKAMEADMAVEMIRALNDMDEVANVKEIIMDDDSTTINHLRKEVDEYLAKSSDKNHVTKGFSNNLFGLQTKHKGKLTYNVIKYIRRLFSIAVAQNKGDPAKLRSSLEAIIPHAHGNHQKCDPSWCKALALDDPSTYRHNGLPRGKPMHCPNLRRALEEIFTRYASQGEKLSHLGSSQANESLNHSIARKAPKSAHYSTSNSLYSRISAAVAEKNEGSTYLLQVNAAMDLSPGLFTNKVAKVRDRTSKKKKLFESTVESKRQRKRLKDQRGQSGASQCTREGPTYESGIATSEPEVNITQIPEPVIAPVPVPLANTESNIVYFDLETTGFSYDCDITQVSACAGNKHFDKYVIPSKPISEVASKATAMTFQEGGLYHKGSPVQAASPKEVLERFINFLPMNCMLVAHNGHVFDGPVLINQLQNYNLFTAFEEKCKGFADTLVIMKKLFPGQKGQGQYAQVMLCKELCDYNYDAHNSLEDVKGLKIMADRLIPVTELYDNALTTDYIQKHLEHNQISKCRLSTFSDITGKGVIGKVMAKKIADSGLELGHLKLAYTRDKECGLRNVLTEKTV